MEWQKQIVVVPIHDIFFKKRKIILIMRLEDKMKQNLDAV